MKNKLKTWLMTVVLILPLLVNGLDAIVYANTGRDISSTHVTDLFVDKESVASRETVVATLKFDDHNGKILAGDTIKVSWPSEGTAKIEAYVGTHKVMAEDENGDDVPIGTAVVTESGVIITFDEGVDSFAEGTVSGGVVFSYDAINSSEEASSETVNITAGSHVVNQTITSQGHNTGGGNQDYPFAYKSGVIRPNASDVVAWDIGLNNMKKEFVSPLIVNDQLVDSPDGHKLLPETISIYVAGNVNDAYYGLEGIEKFKAVFGAEFTYDAELGKIYINIPATKGLSSGTSFRVIYKSKIIDPELESFSNTLVVNYQEEGQSPANESLPHKVNNINSGAWAEGSNLGRLKIIKTDKADNKLLSNAIFELKDSTGKVVGDQIITNENGEATVKRLPLGTYTLTEIQAPDGYKLEGTPQTIKIEKNKETKNLTEITVENEKNDPKGHLEITKIDEAEATKVLAGATFELRNSDGELVGEPIVTDQHGKGTLRDLALGDYTLTEIIAPSGYELNGDAIPVTIKEDETTKNTTVLTIKNKKIVPIIPKGHLEITKIDEAEATKVLAGATFELRNSDGELVGEPIVTDEHGQGTLRDLALGDYQLVETIAPSGYELNGDAIPVTIKEDETTKNTTVLTIKNKKIVPIIPKGSLEITKTAEKTGKVLAGATFELRNSDGELVGEPIVTDEHGQATVSDLSLGDYTLTETIAPKGYVLDKTAHVVKIVANKETQNLTKITITNKENLPWTGKPTPEPSTPKEDDVKQPKKEIKTNKQVASGKNLPQAGEKTNSILLMLGLGLLASVFVVKKRRNHSH